MDCIALRVVLCGNKVVQKQRSQVFTADTVRGSAGETLDSAQLDDGLFQLDRPQLPT